MKKPPIVFFVSAILAIALLSSSAHAGALYKTFTGLGVGNVSLGLSGCPDITCPSGHTCFCAEGTFPFKSPGVGGIGAGNVHLEMLMDNNTQTPGVTGDCENGGGKAVFTSTKGGNQLTFALTGSFCQTVQSDSRAAVVTGGFTIVPGAGTFSNVGGSGSFSLGDALFTSPGVSVVQLQLSGNFNKTAVAPQAALGNEDDLLTNMR
jgi:hypothetical protein